MKPVQRNIVLIAKNTIAATPVMAVAAVNASQTATDEAVDEVDTPQTEPPAFNMA